MKLHPKNTEFKDQKEKKTNLNYKYPIISIFIIYLCFNVYKIGKKCPFRGSVSFSFYCHRIFDKSLFANMSTLFFFFFFFACCCSLSGNYAFFLFYVFVFLLSFFYVFVFFFFLFSFLCFCFLSFFFFSFFLLLFCFAYCYSLFRKLRICSKT